jgi:hypothetical protein
MLVECLRCHEVLKHQARGLCSHCYEAARWDGTIHVYPLVGAYVSRGSLVCTCTKPLVEALMEWNDYQCGECGRRITPERMKELGL